MYLELIFRLYNTEEFLRIMENVKIVSVIYTQPLISIALLSLWQRRCWGRNQQVKVFISCFLKLVAFIIIIFKSTVYSAFKKAITLVLQNRFKH